MTKTKCEICGGMFNRMGVHMSRKHKGVTSSAPAPPPSGTVHFISTRSPSLTVVISPSYWGTVDSPVGQRLMLIPGKRVDFQDGKFATSDPEVINFLENTYKDARFPVISNRKVSSQLME